MSLTKQDLQLIKEVVGEVFDEKFQPAFDIAFERSFQSAFDKAFNKAFGPAFDKAFDKAFDIAFDRAFDKRFKPAFEEAFDEKLTIIQSMISESAIAQTDIMFKYFASKDDLDIAVEKLTSTSLDSRVITLEKTVANHSYKLDVDPLPWIEEKLKSLKN
ncbi:hypothetical protein KC669_00050 [Candidatus Dojkabacteria bacterium]|uniref:Uncharacterized protein n=1 Tax=Candidatus Dojkabacteria bacterium TaxID=2099670 RepID=A0A955L9A4_9BACT|nr:hypothetical protein [Candidatus Dojkabacteria bacterium]